MNQSSTTNTNFQMINNADSSLFQSSAQAAPGQVSFSTSFTNIDLQKSMSLMRNFQGIPVVEQQLQSDDQKIDKYLSLRDLREFLATATPDQQQHQDQALETFQNRVLLGKIAERMINSQSDDHKPLEYSSDEDFLPQINSHNRQRQLSLLQNPQVQQQNATSTSAHNSLDIFQEREDKNGQSVMRGLDIELSEEAQVKLFIEQAKDLFAKERGRDAAKKLNLGDVKSTKVETCVILQQHYINEEELQQKVNKNTTTLFGNVKAIIPIAREKLLLDTSSLDLSDQQAKPRYKRGVLQPLLEKRIFGVLTRYQVGHVPGVNICFTEGEDTFVRDSYIFKSVINPNPTQNQQQQQQSQNQIQQNLSSQAKCRFSLKKEFAKLREYGDYSKQAIAEDLIDQAVEVGTLTQIETFHKYIMNDLFKEEKAIDFSKAWLKGREIDKKYYIVPLKRVFTKDFNNDDQIEYTIDQYLMKKIENIAKFGYRGCQVPIVEEIKQKGIVDKEDYLNKHILVKEDKPHRCYHFFQLLENLKQMPAEEFALAIKGKPENLGCKTAYELLFKQATRFQSITTFRECVFKGQSGDKDQIENYPIMLLDPTKVISHHKFKYALDQCPKNLINAKNAYKKNFKEKNNLTTSQGKPIFSSFNIYRHYLNTEQWKRASQLPLTLLFFERALYCHQLTAELGTEIHPEFVLWATSAPGNQSSKKCYETLETYGDTILKLAATLLSYYHLTTQEGRDVDESKIDQLKIVFITNLYLFRIGKRLKLSRFIRSLEPDLKTWNPPFSEQVQQNENLTCTGKNIADCVEALLGAHFMTNNLRKTLQLISDMKIVPMQQAKLLERFPDKDLTFVLGEDLDQYDFDIDKDKVEDIFQKYFRVQSDIDQISQQRLKSIIDSTKPMDLFGSAYAQLMNDTSINIRDMGSRELEKKLIEYLLPVETLLNYNFQDKFLLLEAFTHKSFKESYGLTLCYEKLEVLGDSILDYIANSNLIKYTILEKYNLKERLAQQYISSEDFQPFDAHQAKSLLTKNDFLAKLVCLFGLHPYILYFKPKQLTISEIKEQLIAENNGILEQWKLKKKLKDVQNEKDADKYIQYSFRKDFLINGKECEIFEPPKILGDVFESLMGAIFQDGGIEKVIEVYQHLLAPFILFTAKHSKNLYKEPKEDFMILANQLKIKPVMKQTELEVDNLKDYVTHNNYDSMNHPSQPLYQMQDIHNAASASTLQNQQDSNIVDTIMNGNQNDDENLKRKYRLLKCDIIYNNNEIMTTGYGNTKKQAERNASIMGYQWLIQNKVQAVVTGGDNNMIMSEIEDQ